MATYDVVDGVGIIPPGTERVEEKAFYSNKDLKSIVIPDYAFHDSADLEIVTFDGVEIEMDKKGMYSQDVRH